jgi:hypothetical protein
MDEPKNNKCEITFKCRHTFSDPCVYFKSSGGPARCKYCCYPDFACGSAVANVNRMVIEAGDMGIELCQK